MISETIYTDEYMRGIDGQRHEMQGVVVVKIGYISDEVVQVCRSSLSLRRGKRLERAGEVEGTSVIEIQAQQETV